MKYDKQTQKNFEILYKLNWPVEEYRVFGGGIMSALNLKPWRDIDLVVSENLYEWIREEYKDDYWYSEETHLPIHFNSIPVEISWDDSTEASTWLNPSGLSGRGDRIIDTTGIRLHWLEIDV